MVPIHLRMAGCTFCWAGVPDPQLVAAEVDGAVDDMLPRAQALGPIILPPLAPWVPEVEAGFLLRAGWAQEEAAEADYVERLHWELDRIAEEERQAGRRLHCRL